MAIHHARPPPPICGSHVGLGLAAWVVANLLGIIGWEPDHGGRMDHVMELPEFLGVPVAILVVANLSVHWIELTPEYRALKNARK